MRVNPYLKVSMYRKERERETYTADMEKGTGFDIYRQRYLNEGIYPFEDINAIRIVQSKFQSESLTTLSNANVYLAGINMRT